MWRVGKESPCTVYFDDILHGMVHSPEIAARIVAAMNAAEDEGRCHHRRFTEEGPMERCDLPRGHEGRHSGPSPWDELSRCSPSTIAAVMGAPLPTAEPARRPLDPLSFEASAHYANKVNEPARKVCNGKCRPAPLSFDPGCPLHAARKAMCGTCGGSGMGPHGTCTVCYNGAPG